MKVVISGVNLVEGGILSILQDALKSFSNLPERFHLEITVFVHQKTLVNEFLNCPGFTFIEYPEIKSSWFKRLYFEYVQCKAISNQIKPDLWVSLHDITPNVNCINQVVYFHNPSPFYKLDIRRFFYDITFSLFCLFYQNLYAINIKRNFYVIVQQSWFRQSLKNKYGINSIVANPVIAKPDGNVVDENLNSLAINFKKFTFFYPSFPRIFKNFEILFEAAKELENKNLDIEIIVTIKGNENKYAKYLYEKYSNLKTIKFIGIQKRSVIESLYAKVDCLIFASKLETWGLPISEFIPFNKPIIVADLPYAHETIGNFSKVKFFTPSNSSQLANYMKQLIKNELDFDTNSFTKPDEPYFNNWDDLVIFLIKQTAIKKSLLD